MTHIKREVPDYGKGSGQNWLKDHGTQGAGRPSSEKKADMVKAGLINKR